MTVYDPIATGNALTVVPELAYVNTAPSALDGAEVMVVVTAWPEFAEVNPRDLSPAASSMTVIDACQGLDIAKWQEAGWTVRSLTGEDIKSPSPDKSAA